jgi:hypothetical protein
MTMGDSLAYATMRLPQKIKRFGFWNFDILSRSARSNP